MWVQLGGHGNEWSRWRVSRGRAWCGKAKQRASASCIRCLPITSRISGTERKVFSLLILWDLVANV